MATLGHLLDGNTLALWRLDEASGTAFDETGTYPLTNVVGAPPVVAGRIGNARAFTINQGLTSANKATNDPLIAVLQAGTFTAETWFWIDPSITNPATWPGAGNGHAALFAVQGSGNGTPFLFGLDTTSFFVYNVTNGFTAVGSWATLSTGAWHHLAVRCTSSDGTHSIADFFLDGVKIGSTTVLKYALTPNTAWVFCMGGEGTGFNCFTGRIDDSRFSRVARTDAEISDSFWRGIIDRTVVQPAAFQETNSTAWQQYLKQIATTEMQQPVGSAVRSALASQLDYASDRVRLAIKAKFPSLAPPDALTQLGIERGMPQGVSESGSAYAARLVDAWNAWPWAGTAFGLLRAFYATGYTNVVLAQVRGGQEFTLDSGASNSLLWSTDLTNSAWNKRGTAAVTRNAAVAPDGTTTAAQLSGIGAALGNDFFQTVGGGVTGTPYNPSFFIKRISASGTLELHNPNGTGGSCVIDLAAIGAGWVRVDPGAPSTGITTPGAFSVQGGNSGIHLYATAGAPLSFNIWMPQSEIGATSAGAPTPTYNVADTSTIGAGVLVTAALPNALWETDALSSYSPVNQSFWSKFDVIFPLPLMPPSWGWAGGIPASNSSEANFIRALIQAWKPAHATCNRIVIQTQGKLLGYPTSRVLGSNMGVLGATSTVWTP